MAGLHEPVHRINSNIHCWKVKKKKKKKASGTVVVCHYLRERKEHIYTYVPYANTFWKDTQETITVAASREGICTAGDSCGREDFSLLYFL